MQANPESQGLKERWSAAGAGPLTFTFITVSSVPAPAAGDVQAGTARLDVASHCTHEDPRPFTLTVNDRTEILSAGRRIALSDLKNGDGAVVVYRSYEGLDVALSIEVRND